MYTQDKPEKHTHTIHTHTRQIRCNKQALNKKKTDPTLSLSKIFLRKLEQQLTVSL